MNTKILMTLSGYFMFVAGVILSFFPQEALKMLGETASPVTLIVLQITGALYFGFGMLNKMAKGSIMGGIYNRPIAMGNFMHFLVAGIALLKSTSVFNNSPYIWTAAVIYTSFAIAFGLVVFTHPKEVKISA
jgi:hypothetical protein